ncbi:MAG: hypothetical protein IJ863_04750 [Spirochaetales bacterium]|nr:hypothetical protein [Spirochaetales bacterium]
MSRKRLKGEKYDAYLVKNIEPMQAFMTSLLGSRIENEAVCNFDIEMSALEDYIQRRNSENPEFKYTFYHVFCAALARTIAERPRMNYFIRNGKFYERKKITMASVAKKVKADGAEEGLIIMDYDRGSEVSPIEQMHNLICSQVNHLRKDEQSHDSTTDIMKKLVSLPGPIYKLVVKMIVRLDRKGNLPKDLVDVNPYSQTCFISNLGSIRMDANYHHLANFGSNSFFAIIGKKELKPCFNPDGTYKMKMYLPISFTIDERIADGVYFNNSIKVLKAYMMKPELLDRPASESIDIRKVEEEFGL